MRISYYGDDPRYRDYATWADLYARRTMGELWGRPDSEEVGRRHSAGYGLHPTTEEWTRREDDEVPEKLDSWGDLERLVARNLFPAPGSPGDDQVTIDWTGSGPVTTRVLRNANDEREENEMAVFSHNTPVSNPQGARTEVLRRRLDAMADELARLEARPTLPTKAGTVLRFKKRFPTSAYPDRRYVFAAVLGAEGRWFVTGRYNAAKTYGPDELLDLVGDEDMGTLRVSSGWVPLAPAAGERS